MSDARRVRSFDSSSPEYRRAFETFLGHTDQKDRAMEWLRREVDSLADCSVLIDAGAGNGTLTARLAPLFRAAIAIEPNPSLVKKLRTACPAATVIPAPITAASPTSTGNFILCSHVFYYIPEAEWGSTLVRMMGWLAHGGILAVTIQNPRSDGMRMLDHFLGVRFDLGEVRRAAEEAGPDFQTHLETVPARVRALDLGTACEIAEFLLNSMHMPSPPAWAEVEQYVEEHFRQGDGSYEFSCDQDFLRVTRPA